MKLQIITERKEILKSQKLLKQKIINSSSGYITGDVGYHGKEEEFPTKIYYLDSANIWVTFAESPNRYWNAFGINEPSKNIPNSIRAEINLPHDGLHGAAARFAKDSRGNVYLLHTGRIGGGQPGIGKTLFYKKYKGKIYKVNSNKKIEKLVCIDKLSSKDLIKKIGAFVWAVHSIKTNRNVFPPAFEINKAVRKFQKEFTGKKRYSNKLNILAECNHGKIVNALYKLLKRKTKLLKKDISNNKNVDLYIFNNANTKIALFEVKTKINTTSLYQAVGQLLVNASFEKNKPKLFAVLPSNYFSKNLKKLGINTITYSLKNSKIKFHGLQNL